MQALINLTDIPELTDIDVVSWDVDGTLYSMRRMLAGLTRIAAKRMLIGDHKICVRELTKLARFRHYMNRIRACGGELPRDEFSAIRQATIDLENRWYGPAIERAGPRDGVGELIEQFGKAGLAQIVVSDFLCAYKLDALGLAHAFEATFAGESLGFVKPSPVLFQFAAENVGVPTGRILHIGDRADRDGSAAAAAGCHVVIIRS